MNHRPWGRRYNNIISILLGTSTASEQFVSTIFLKMFLFSDLSNMVRGANDDTRFIVKDYNSVEHATRITKDFLHNLNQLNYNVDRHST